MPINVPIDQQSLLTLATLQHLTRNVAPLNALRKAFSQYEELRHQRTEQPDIVIHRFHHRCLERRRPRQGEAWLFRDLWEKEDYTRCRSVGRLTFLLQEIAEEMFRGNVKTALATTLLAWEAGHQYGAQRGP